MAGIGAFETAIQEAILRLWAGAVDTFTFLELMNVALTEGYTEAFLEGAELCGISVIEELNEAERDELQANINEDAFWAIGLAEDIVVGRINEVPLSRFITRSRMWVNRYGAVRATGQLMVCHNQKTEWQIGVTDKHCRSCEGFDGRVYRNEVWLKNGAIPQSRNLACTGRYCDCNLAETSAPITRGRFPLGLLGKEKEDYAYETS